MLPAPSIHSSLYPHQHPHAHRPIVHDISFTILLGAAVFLTILFGTLYLAYSREL